MDFPGIKKDGKFMMAPAIAEQARKYWASIKEGSTVIKSLKVPRKSKSQNQLGAYWGLAMATAVEQLDDRGYDTSFLLNTPKPTGIAIDRNLLCDYFYNVCPMIDDESGNRITLSKADTKQAAKFFDDVRKFLASQWSIDVPEPDPNWRIHESTNKSNNM
ncbi:MAG: hypothetical protein KAS32_10530 [Candidatus Peribacteraceae bacterium]|nr:hypothetical protein [Candidatus Peribacteraceae bacterium]